MYMYMYIHTYIRTVHIWYGDLHPYVHTRKAGGEGGVSVCLSSVYLVGWVPLTPLPFLYNQSSRYTYTYTYIYRQAQARRPGTVR